MRYALLSDIHGNLEALLAVLADLGKRSVDRLYCLGDVIGYGPNPGECLEILRSLGCPALMGNHEYHIVAQTPATELNPLVHAGLELARRSIKPSGLEHLAEFPLTLTTEHFILVHASLAQPKKWPYLNTPSLAQRHFLKQTQPLAFYGHLHETQAWLFDQALHQVHYQKIHLQEGVRYLLNTGSVGQPRDGDSRAAYALYDTERQRVEIWRVPYEVAKTQKKIRAEGLPEELALRLETGS